MFEVSTLRLYNAVLTCCVFTVTKHVLKCPRNRTMNESSNFEGENRLSFKLKHRKAQKVHFIREILMAERGRSVPYPGELA